jgi:hypothetical protein
MSRILLQQAFDAILAARDSELLHPKPFKNRYLDIIGKLESELAKPNQEPYCWVQSKLNQGLFYKEKPRRIHTIPLYTAPPRKSEQIITPISIDQYERVCFTCGACVGKPWVGLNAKDLSEIPPSCFEGAIWADGKLKEKNT